MSNKHMFSGKWICAEMTVEDRFAPIFKKDFIISKDIRKAEIFICGLGLFELRVNGSLPDDSVLNPAHSQYSKTVLYRVFNITDLLCSGKNTVTVELGNSFFNETTNVWDWDTASWRSAPKMIADIAISYTDGSAESIITDEAWQVTLDGPTVANSIYYGETYDARRTEFSWRSAKLADAPAGELKEQYMPPIRRTNKMKPKNIKRIENGFLIEAPEMVTGWAAISINTPKDTETVITYGEKLRDDGLVQKIGMYEGHNGEWWPDAYIQQDKFISSGSPAVFEPKFSYKGFKYIQIDNIQDNFSADDIVIYRTANDVETVSDFKCSEELINKLHVIMRRTMFNNFQGKPTDTPVWEKNGWLGDANCALDVMMYNFDMSNYMTSFVDIMNDCFEEYGSVPVIVPTADWGIGNSPVWNTIYVFAVEAMINYCGNKEYVEKIYPNLRKFALNDIAELDSLGGTWGTRGLSDWLSPMGGEDLPIDPNPSESAEICCTSYIYAMLKSMARISDILGKEDSGEYLDAAKRICDAFNEKFYNKEKKIYETTVWNQKGSRRKYRQTSNLLPLSFGMVPEESKEAVLGNLIKDIVEHDYHLDTGCTGTKHLLPVLFNEGYADIAYKLLTQTTYPSWGYWVENGADSAWESWEKATRSLDHYFLGTYDEILYSHIAGIRNIKDGYKHFTVAPEIGCGLDWAEAYINSPQGRIRCKWHCESGRAKVEIEIPDGSAAEIILPGGINEAHSGGIYNYEVTL